MFPTLNGPRYKKNEKYMKKHECNHVFHVFLIFRVSGSITSMQHGYSMDEESNSTSNECSSSKFEQNHREIS